MIHLMQIPKVTSSWLMRFMEIGDSGKAYIRYLLSQHIATFPKTIPQVN
jgi:hypothetical protein